MLVAFDVERLRCELLLLSESGGRAIQWCRCVRVLCSSYPSKQITASTEGQWIAPAAAIDPLQPLTAVPLNGELRLLRFLSRFVPFLDSAAVGIELHPPAILAVVPNRECAKHIYLRRATEQPLHIGLR